MNELQAFMTANGQTDQVKRLRKKESEYVTHVRPVRVAWRWIRERARDFANVDLDAIPKTTFEEVREAWREEQYEFTLKKKELSLAKMPTDKREAVQRKMREKLHPATPTSKETKEVRGFVRHAYAVHAFCDSIADCPKWLEMCRKCFTATNLPHVKDNGKIWDLYTLAKIVIAHLPEHLSVRPFEAIVGDQFGVVDTMLKRLLNTVTLRTWRAKKNPPTKPEVLQCLADLAKVMEIFGCDSKATSDIQQMHA